MACTCPNKSNEKGKGGLLKQEEFALAWTSEDKQVYHNILHVHSAHHSMHMRICLCEQDLMSHVLRV